MNPGTFRFTVWGSDLKELEQNANFEIRRLGGNWIITHFDIEDRTDRFVATVEAEAILTLGE